MIEIEQRYKIYSPQAMLRTLAKREIAMTREQHVIDKWFIPGFIHNQQVHDEWFDGSHGIAYRIRRLQQPDGTVHSVLDSKQHTSANNHNTFKEELLLENDEAAMYDLLKQKDYYNWLTIDKERRYFSHPTPGLEIVMDTVARVKGALGVDTVLEIEYQGQGTREQALRAIEALAATIGLGPTLLFDKSLTVESMRVLAKFQ